MIYILIKIMKVMNNRDINLIMSMIEQTQLPKN
jgi:hypothetical protein